jgi:hypothetical protein
LGLQAGFPTLIAQALDWLDGQPPGQADVVIGSLARGQEDQVRQAFQPDLPRPLACGQGNARLVRLESLTYRPMDLSGTDLRVPNDIGSEASALVLPKPWPPLWIVPAVLAAVVVILEWCLYQRRWTS